MAERRTDPDTLIALANDIREIKIGLKNEIADLSGHVLRLDGTIGQPAEPGKFEGDPPKPATGLCATIDRIAKEQARRTRLSVLSATGVAAVLTAIAQLVIATHAWTPSPASSKPVASATPDGR